MPKKVYGFLFAGLFLFFMSSGYPASAQPAAKEVFVLKGTVVSLSGTVKFRNEKTVLWKDVQLGQEVIKGDHIRTEKDGKVAIEFTNGNLLALKEDSAITIDELQSDPATGKYDAVFKTIKAKIKAEVNDQSNLKTFEIRTPTAVAGVRGTIFYLNVTEQFTEAFVERGKLNLLNESSHDEQDVPTGFFATADDKGGVSEPVVPPPEQTQEFQDFLEPETRLYTPPPPPDESQPPPAEQTEEGGTTEPLADTSLPPLPEADSLLQDVVNSVDQSQQQQQQVLLDQTVSQEVNKTNYISNPPPPTGSNSNDTDGDGILNSVDPDDDNDFLPDLQEVTFGTDPLNLDSDSDALSDWEELKLVTSNPLIRDTDGDGIDDGGEAFPTVAASFEPMNPIRAYRYNKLDVIPGLRAEISSMLTNSAERNRDYIMDRISDAQMHKVLKDRTGGWVRYEEYIFRPTPNELEMMSLTYRTSVQLSSLSWRFVFNGVTGLSSQTIKNLPWNSYFSAIPSYGLTAPAHYPSQMNVTIARGTSNSVEEVRTLSAPNFAGNWIQTVTSDQVRTDGGGLANAASTNLIAGNPAAFDYDLGGPLVEFFMYVVRDSDGALSGNTFNVASLWQVLGANLGAGFPVVSPGEHIEIQTSYGGGPTFIEVVYEPMDRLLWRGSIDWPDQLTW